ncbi:protein sel-1 homolog 3-like [Eublepharis macularius]|uniref:Protein sel-1 homolog 3-like n=1 Tax=Eublepharis macularius TaxID=481883 RepID=A0AA97J3P6_EUBMA|nr:protein sel-1 homolog 3-like [Eublepharis macularius]
MLNQAAEQGFLPALTALGWYYQVFENDYRRAVEFWEKADEMGDPVAPSNLGAFYVYGQYPGKDRDEEDEAAESQRHCSAPTSVQKLGNCRDHPTAVIMQTLSLGPRRLQPQPCKDLPWFLPCTFPYETSPFSCGLICRFPESLYLNDEEGWFVLGDSKYILGVQGFFGPSSYYRSSTQASLQTEPPKLLQHLDLPQWFATCQKFKDAVFARLPLYQLQRAWKLWQETCHPEYEALAVQQRTSSPGEPRCWQWEAPYPRRRAAVYTLLQRAVWRRGDQFVNMETVAGALFQRFEKRVAGLQDLAHLNNFYPQLLQAGCLGHSRALYLISTLHRTGLGLPLDSTKADDRLSGMQLGHKHHLGVDGLPVDHDLSYAYYANVAAQTVADRELSREGQAFVEHIRLTDEDALKLQTKENDDLFVWLRFQARRGMAEAQQAVSRMLFWGQQGISSKLKEAVKFYEKGAARLKDPTLMYDYGVVLLKGTVTVPVVPWTGGCSRQQSLISTASHNGK